MAGKLLKTKGKKPTHCIVSPVMRQRLVSLRHAAEYLDRSEDSVRELVYLGTFPVIQLGDRSKMWLDLQDIDQWITSRKKTLGA